MHAVVKLTPMQSDVVCYVYIPIFTYIHTNSYTYMQFSNSHPCTGCVSGCGVINTASGNITDGSGLASYADNANCEWMLAPGQLVHVCV